MNKGLTSLERHEGEYDRTFIFRWTNPLKYFYLCDGKAGIPQCHMIFLKSFLFTVLKIWLL